MIIRGGYWSDIGCRDVNQDAVMYRMVEQDGECFVLTAVCDGIGGLEHGEVASSFLVGRLEIWFKEIVKWLDIGKADPEVIFCHLKDGAEEWNEELRELQKREHLHTGSTMSVLMVLRDRYFIIHVGDSRVYRFRSGLEQLTEDASVPRLKNGRIKNYLDNFMGKSETLKFQELKGIVEDGDMFVVCSDGLYHHFEPDDAVFLHQSCARSDEIPMFCAQVIQRMPERGELDNISMTVIFAGQSVSAED